MTTNVFCEHGRMLASDSRWSVLSANNLLFFVDDTGFDKIEVLTQWAFVFAGEGMGIQRWKDWIRSAPTSAAAMPAVDGVAVCIVDTATNTVRFALKQEIVRDGGYFAGSGALPAYLCWSTNKDARRAVDSAKGADRCTGGEVKYFDCVLKNHNLSNAVVTIAEVNEVLLTRGYVMDLNKGTPPVKLAEFAANESHVNDIKAKIASGEVSVQAPCDQMYNRWTEEETAELQSVLADVFGWQ
ncbi:hypothetical protein [Roseateles sp. P5_E4]